MISRQSLNSAKIEIHIIYIKILTDLYMETIFTEIIERKIPGFFVYEDENHVAILDKYPIDHGHTLVIPKKPYELITDMPLNEVAVTIPVAFIPLVNLTASVPVSPIIFSTRISDIFDNTFFLFS